MRCFCPEEKSEGINPQLVVLLVFAFILNRVKSNPRKKIQKKSRIKKYTTIVLGKSKFSRYPKERRSIPNPTRPVIETA
jgi:hypothetical protein